MTIRVPLVWALVMALPAQPGPTERGTVFRAVVHAVFGMQTQRGLMAVQLEKRAVGALRDSAIVHVDVLSTGIGGQRGRGSAAFISRELVLVPNASGWRVARHRVIARGGS